VAERQRVTDVAHGGGVGDERDERDERDEGSRCGRR
jgi:hypothetical protein